MNVLRRSALALSAVLLIVLAVATLTPVPHAAALTGPAAATATKTKTKTKTKTATKTSTRTSTNTATTTPTVTNTATITPTASRTPTPSATTSPNSGVAISAGGRITCVVDTLGQLRCVGNSPYGALGVGDTVVRGATASTALTVMPYIDLGTGAFVRNMQTSENSCAVLSTGAVKCWGLNDAGSLGYEHERMLGDEAGEMGDALPTVALPTGRTAAVVATGPRNTCVILDNGSLTCWGYVLGTKDGIRHGATAGTMGDNLGIIDLGTGRTVTAVGVGDISACVLLDNGVFKCFGSNQNGILLNPSVGQIGENASPADMGDNLQPMALGTGLTVKSFSLGVYHACAILSNNALKCWGYNEYGQLGNGNTQTIGDDAGEIGDNLPTVDLGTGRYAVKVAVYNNHSCALLDNATMKCWGSNGSGALGNESGATIGDEPGEMGDNLPAINLGTTETVDQIVLGESHTCVLFTTRMMRCFGHGPSGSLGYGNSNNIGDAPDTMGSYLPAYPADALTAAYTSTPTKTVTTTVSPTRTATKSPTRSKTLTKSRTPTKKP